MAENCEKDTRVPVTVLIGYLGAGKTTLLNRILTEKAGAAYAVIVNEFGELGIDDKLVRRRIDAEEDIFEMNNGCICCTVRADLSRILNKLLAPGMKKLDGVIVETTGLADPAPVAQTFFVDEVLKERARLDAIVTVVDAKHVIPRLDEVKPEGVENEAIEQVALADRLLLNKIDLVPEEADLRRVEARLKLLNRYAPIVRCENASVALDHVFGIQAFELERALERDSAFLQVDRDETTALQCEPVAAPWHSPGCDDLECADPMCGPASRKVGHVHDSQVSSVGFLRGGELEMKRTNEWISTLLQVPS